MHEPMLVKPPRPAEEGSDVALAILLALARLRVPLSFASIPAVTEHNGRAVSAALAGLVARGRIQRLTGPGGEHTFGLITKGRAC